MSSSSSLYRRALSRVQLRFRRARPGSVLIMVVALLVLMALIGTAYITTAQTDRYSAQQNAFNTEIDLLVQGVINMVDGTLAQDLYSSGVSSFLPAQTRYRSGAASTTYAPYTTTGTPAGAALPPQPWLGDRIPVTQLMQTLGGGTTSWAPWVNNTNTGVSNSNPAIWAFVSAPPTGTGWQFESPYVGPTTPNPAIYTTRTNLQPTYIPVTTGNTSVVYPALFDGTYTYLAADADGDGVADTGLYRLPVGEINGVTYYAGVRIVDNAAAVNASVAYAVYHAGETNHYPKCLFLPTQIGLDTLMVDNVNELANVDRYRMGVASNINTGVFQMPTRVAVDDTQTTRMDFSYYDVFQNEWFQLGRRLDNPGYFQLSGNVFQFQALPPSEGALMARKFILRDPSVTDHTSSTSALEQYIPRSVFCATPQQSPTTANPDTGLYSSTPYTNVMTWFNGNFNYSVAASANTLPVNTLPIRPLLTARNGVSNFVPNKFTWKPTTATATTNAWSAATLYNFGDWVTGSDGRAYVCINAPLPPSTTSAGAPTGVLTIDPTSAASTTAWAAEPWSNAPTKTSANTGSFGELWAAYWSVMWDSSLANTNANAAGVPVGTDLTMFRSAVRTTATPPALTPRQMLQLRSALAAVNTIGLRESDGQRLTGFGDVTSRSITINSDGTSPAYATTVFSGEANPYITEVYADATNNYIAIELYNPFQWPVTLNNWQLATIARSGTTVGPITVLANLTSATNTAPTIPAQGYAVIATSLTPPSGTTTAKAPALVAVPQLIQAFNNELVLLRPRRTGMFASNSPAASSVFPLTSCSNTGPFTNIHFSDNGDPARDYAESATVPGSLVPVDSYDFTGLITPAPDPNFAVWHYVRPNDSSMAGGKAWHFVYPGQYVPGNASAPVTAPSLGSAPFTAIAVNPNQPRQTGTNVQPSSVSSLPATFATLGVADAAALLSPFREFAIQIANTDFGGIWKLFQNNNYVPFGSFGRNADLLQVPFIGAYTITSTGTTPALVEMNPVTMDAAFADDGDGLQGENVGRFAPINAGNPVHDLTPTPAAPNPVPNDYALPGANGTNSVWRYHWAMQLFDYLTVQCPQKDFLPEVDPEHYVWFTNLFAYAPIGPVTPVANANPKIANASATNMPANSTEDTVPVNGLININTASWRILATLPLVLQAGTDQPDAANTAALAQTIVHFRDVDDGSLGGPPNLHPHGPFSSIYELNLVPGFRTAMGTIPNPGGAGAGTLDDGAGDITPNNDTIGIRGAAAGAFTTDNVVNNYEQQNMAVTRISNLITTHSDSFTVYIIVQGFRNAGTASPQLVVQRRAAFIADRSTVTPNNSNISSLNVPVN